MKDQDLPGSSWHTVMRFLNDGVTHSFELDVFSASPKMQLRPVVIEFSRARCSLSIILEGRATSIFANRIDTGQYTIRFVNYDKLESMHLKISMLNDKYKKSEKRGLKLSLQAIAWIIAILAIVLAFFGQSLSEIGIANKLSKGGGEYEMDSRWRVVEITLRRRNKVDVGHLNSLRSLHSVRLEQCEIGDASVLEKINCSELIVDDCRTVRKGEINLKFRGSRLVLDLKLFSRVGELSECFNLNSLSIWNPSTTKPIDLAKIDRLQASTLKILAIHGCRLLSISELKNLENLNELILYGCEVGDSDFVSQLRGLSSISLIGSKPGNLAGFETATNLKTFTHDGLSFSDDEIEKIKRWIPHCKIGP